MSTIHDQLDGIYAALVVLVFLVGTIAGGLLWAYLRGSRGRR